jgi:hypothetical protein
MWCAVRLISARCLAAVAAAAAGADAPPDQQHLISSTSAVARVRDRRYIGYRY